MCVHKLESLFLLRFSNYNTAFRTELRCSFGTTVAGYTYFGKEWEISVVCLVKASHYIILPALTSLFLSVQLRHKSWSNLAILGQKGASSAMFVWVMSSLWHTSIRLTKPALFWAKLSEIMTLLQSSLTGQEKAAAGGLDGLDGGQQVVQTHRESRGDWMEQ